MSLPMYDSTQKLMDRLKVDKNTRYVYIRFNMLFYSKNLNFILLCSMYVSPAQRLLESNIYEPTRQIFKVCMVIIIQIAKNLVFALYKKSSKYLLHGKPEYTSLFYYLPKFINITRKIAR